MLAVAHDGAPVRGVRVTARRGVWAKSGPWQRFEDQVTFVGWVSVLDEQAVEVEHGWLTVSVLLGDVEDVTDDVSLMELSRNPSVAEALAFAGSGQAA